MAEVHHTGFAVGDLERSVDFYRAGFGCSEVHRGSLSGPEVEAAVGVPGAVIEVALLAAGNTLVELLHYRAPVGNAFTLSNNDIGAAHLCFVVDDIDATYERLQGIGARPIAPPGAAEASGIAAGTRFAYVRDPDGVTVEILQPGLTFRTNELLAADHGA